jgi:hypothetical protein
VSPPAGQRSTVSCLVGDARALHSDPEFEGAVSGRLAVLLEMVSPHVTPEAWGWRAAESELGDGIS